MASGKDESMEIEALLQEGRQFAPPDSFREKATVADEAVYREAAEDREGFWARMAGELEWMKPWSKVLEWKPPHARWFVDGKLNVSVNCLDRHVRTWRRNKAALIWEGEPGDTRTLTYWDLYREVNRRVAIYLPMIPELPIAMLACTRVGAVHSVVFGGFSAESLRDRINDAEAKLVITADGGYRRGSVIPLKKMADEALDGTPSVEHVVVVNRGDFEINFMEGRDLWWHELMKDAGDRCPPEEMDAEDMLYILYTSGTTGKPKGIVHTTGGYLTGVYATTKWVFDLKEDDVWWCTADIGWVTGHSYLVYGPLALGVTGVMYEGAPNWPENDRFWTIVAKYGVTVFYTAPTLIRAFMKWGSDWPAKHDLSSLRLLGTVGEPINPEAWMWYHEHVGRGKCPIVDTWWQTETGMILITPLPGVTTLTPGSATRAFPGIEADILNEQGKSIEVGGGFLAIKSPWPAMLRGIYGDPARYVEQYWSKWSSETYFPGDGAKRDKDGYFWILGRVDDVLNVAGHRIGTMEVESALVDFQGVAEAAVVGRSHEIKGQGISAFVTLKEGIESSDGLIDELKEHVVKKIGAIARPDDILFAADLPKTRSGKIMRRLLRDIAEGKTLGDTTTLADPAVVEKLKQKYEEEAE
jgi:acetyl-CoA synthetase